MPVIFARDVRQPISRTVLYILLLACVLGLAACGDGNTSVVAGDETDTNQDSGDSSSGDSNSTGGDTSAGNTGGNTRDNTGEDRGGDDANGGGNTPTVPADGDPLLADLDASPAMATYSCRVESVPGTAVEQIRVLSFDRSSLTFSVNGTPVVQGGFAWNAETMEWSTSTLNDANGVIQEYFAKVDAANLPTYFRSKTTQPDFSFEQTECYQGLAVPGPFLDGIPETLAAEPVACRRVATSLTGEITADTGIVEQEYLVTNGTFLANLISDATDTATIVVTRPLPPTSSSTVLANGDVKYETSITASFTRTSELVVDAIGRFKYARSQAASRAGNAQTYCGTGVEAFIP
ncbi:MAG: hypothetical protein WBD13_01840 [Burkholderiaceae bacterium]